MNPRQSRNARIFASAQRAYDNMTPEDDPAPEEEATEEETEEPAK